MLGLYFLNGYYFYPGRHLSKMKCEIESISESRNESGLRERTAQTHFISETQKEMKSN